MQISLLEEKFKSFLVDPGIQLYHPDKTTLVLDDIFIFPELRHHQGEVINSKKLLGIKKGESKILITGDEDSGKTALVKMLFKNYMLSGYYPVYIDFQNRIIQNPENIIEIIYRRYKEIYRIDSYQNIQKHGKKRKVIFIDNLSESNTDYKLLGEILNFLYSTFDKVITTERLPVSFMNQSQMMRSLPNIAEATQSYQILEFNKQLRTELIYKWNTIGNSENTNEEIVAMRCEKYREIVDTFIEHNLVTPYPLYILTILQSNSEADTKDFSTGSYAFYYEYLITKSLGNSLIGEKLDIYRDVLSDLSYYLFKENKQHLTLKELDSICKNYKCLSSSKNILDSLIIANTINKENSTYRIKYKYIYHYFVARFLSNNMNLESSQTDIKQLCQNLNNDDHANIILFLTYLIDDPVIMKELLQRTKSVFSEERLSAIRDDSPEITELIEEFSRIGDKGRKFKEFTIDYTKSSMNIDRYTLKSEMNKYGEETLGFKVLYETQKLKTARNLLKIIFQIISNRSNKDSYTMVE